MLIAFFMFKNSMYRPRDTAARITLYGIKNRVSPETIMFKEPTIRRVPQIKNVPLEKKSSMPRSLYFTMAYVVKLAIKKVEAGPTAFVIIGPSITTPFETRNILVKMLVIEAMESPSRKYWI
jgi:hypothetical protein